MLREPHFLCQTDSICHKIPNMFMCENHENWNLVETDCIKKISRNARERLIMYQYTGFE